MPDEELNFRFLRKYIVIPRSRWEHLCGAHVGNGVRRCLSRMMVVKAWRVALLDPEHLSGARRVGYLKGAVSSVLMLASLCVVSHIRDVTVVLARVLGCPGTHIFLTGVEADNHRCLGWRGN